MLALERYDEAVRACDTAHALEASVPRSAAIGPPVFPSALRAYALAKGGRRAEAEVTLERIRLQERERWVPQGYSALLLHGLGRDAEAIHQLRRAIDNREPGMTFLGVDPKWDGLRTSPAFQELLSRVNLLEVSNRVLASRARPAER